MVSVNFDNFLGGFTGFYLMDSGKVYEFKNITGIIEFNKAYWWSITNYIKHVITIIVLRRF